MKLSDMNTASKLNMLLLGDSGAGKTVTSTSFPTPLFAHDFDNKLSSAANFWRKYNPEQVAGIEYQEYTDPDPVKLFAIYNTWLINAEKQAKEGAFPWKTVTLDSITLFSSALMRIILAQNPGVKSPIITAPDVPAVQHYGIFGIRFQEYIKRTLALPCNVIMTAHISKEKDEASGLWVFRPMVAGKNAEWLPIVFREVYRQYAETDKEGKTKYLWQTASDRYYTCRTEIPGAPLTMEANYKSIQKLMG